MEKLLTPIALGNVTVKNRVVLPSMCVHFCDSEGYINDCMLDYIRCRAAGGIGLIIVGGSPHGKCGAGRPALSDDKFIPGWKKLADTVHQYGATLFCQLHPAKFQAGRGHAIESPSDYSEEDIAELVESYARGALRCKQAGVDGVDIHGAHAHEIALFLSPLYNKRTDRYGKDYAGRALFPIQIVQAIKKVCGKDFPVSFCISGSEMVEGGREIEETVKIAVLLEKAGADVIHVSAGMPESGGYISAPMDVEDCFNVENAAKVRAAVSIPVMAVNRIVDIAEATEIVDSGKADMVAMGRAHLADPDLVNKYLGINPLPVRRCVGCNQGCRDSKVRKKIICMQNPLLGREHELKMVPATEENKKAKIIIAGAGPAGLEMACDLATRGFMPLVYEKSDKAGGLINLASIPPHKQNMNSITKYRVEYLKMLGIPIHYGKEVTMELLEVEKPDVLVVATGSEPVIPPVPGIGGQNVFNCDQVMSGIEIPGKRIAVMGGGLIGCETADYLAAQGKEVVVIDMISKIAANLNSSRRNFMLKRMSQMPIDYKLESKVEEIRLPEVVISNVEGVQTLTGFDALVVAVGRKPVNDLQAAADRLPNTQVVVLGDAKEVGLALNAIYHAAEAAAGVLA